MDNRTLVIIAVLAAIYFWLNKNQSTYTDNISDLEFTYREYQPEYSNENTPLIVLLHGDMDTAKNFHDTFIRDANIKARVVVVNAPDMERSQKRWGVIAYVAEYQTLLGHSLARLIKELQNKYEVKSKPILLGFSGGAMATAYIALNFPELISSAFIISGGIKDSFINNEVTVSNFPEIYIYHGKKDSVVGIGEAHNMIEKFKQLAIDINYKEYPTENHHGIFNSMRMDIINVLNQKAKELRFAPL